MLSTGQQTIKRAHEHLLQLSEQIARLGTLITTWLVIGSAAGLIVILRLVPDSSCDVAFLQHVATWFVAAMSLAFVGAGITYLQGYSETWNLATQINKLAEIGGIDESQLWLIEKDAEPATDLAEQRAAHLLKYKEITQRARWSWSLVGLMFLAYIAAIACFGGGVWKVATVPPAVLATCRAGIQSAPTANGPALPAAAAKTNSP